MVLLSSPHQTDIICTIKPRGSINLFLIIIKFKRILFVDIFAFLVIYLLEIEQPLDDDNLPLCS